MKKLLSILLLIALVLTLASCSVSDGQVSGNNETYGLNKPAEFKDLKFTATEVTESTGSTILPPDDGNVFVGIKFTIENISSTEQTVSSILLFEAYCDDVKLDYSISAASAFEGTLDGTLAAGKKLIGYYAVEVPTSWNTIELKVQASWLSSTSATFVFNKGNVGETSNDGSTNQTEENQTEGTTSNTPTVTPTNKTYGLNEEATLKNLKITATELKESMGEQYFGPDDGNVFVGIKFTIENISSTEQSISSLLMFNGYCDDVKLEYSLTSSMAFDGTLDGSIAAGKKLVGYYSAEVPSNWKTIEVEVKADLLSNDSTTFAFTK